MVMVDSVAKERKCFFNNVSGGVCELAVTDADSDQEPT